MISFEVDPLNGCAQCICKNPCRETSCPHGTLCKMVSSTCLNTNPNLCSPVPKCKHSLNHNQ